MRIRAPAVAVFRTLPHWSGLAAVALNKVSLSSHFARDGRITETERYTGTPAPCEVVQCRGSKHESTTGLVGFDRWRYRRSLCRPESYRHRGSCSISL